jgi:hypothetical protein
MIILDLSVGLSAVCCRLYCQTMKLTMLRSTREIDSGLQALAVAQLSHVKGDPLFFEAAGGKQ